jgi:hypothetical protein
MVLTYLKAIFGQSLLIFSLDEQLEEPMIQLIKKNYQVTSFPTLIVEDTPIVGNPFVSRSTLQKIICQFLPDEEPCISRE